MPELPEVETIRRQLAARLPGRLVLAADAFQSAKFADATRGVANHFGAVRRRGKFLLIEWGSKHDLVIHLGMTGACHFTPDLPEPVSARNRTPWTRAWWHLDDGSTLVFCDQRRFGRIAYIATGDYQSLPALRNMGPEPLEPAFNVDEFARLLAKSNQHIKTTILSQRAVAGVGNIYADEALWRAGINPSTRRISRNRVARLHQAIIDVLTEAIEHGGTRLRDYRSIDGDTGRHQHHLDCYGRKGQPCTRCETPLHFRTLNGRGTTWCPKCQAR